MAGLLLPGCLLAGCASSGRVEPFAAFRSFAPAASVAAQMPLASNAGEAYQDHLGPAFPVRSGPALNDTGGERIPTFPTDAPPIVSLGGQVLMPNGGERIVQSINSLP